MKIERMVMVLAVIFFIPLAICGCGNKMTQDKRVVARINNYELTVDDFKSEADLVMANKRLSEDPEKAKEELLEEMITKNILIQEAQAQDFDKDKAFMKEIERYWEQALLKLLLKKKTEEFSEKATGPSEEVKRAKVQQMLEKWVTTLRRQAKVKIYKENLGAVVIK